MTRTSKSKVKSRSGARWRASLPAKLILAASSVLVLVAALEISSRLVFEPAPANTFPGLAPNEIADDELLWRNNPSYKKEDLYGPINSLGFRGPEIPADSLAAGLRLLSIGESTTFGYNLPWRASYSFRLEQILRSRGHPAFVLNAGVRGWSTLQGVRYLARDIDSIRPHIVLFYFEINDFLSTTFRGIALQGAGLTDRQVIRVMRQRSWIHALIRKSRFLSGLRLARARSQVSHRIREAAKKLNKDVLVINAIPFADIPEVSAGSPKPWVANTNTLSRVPDSDREACLRDLIALTRRRGITLVLIHPVYPVSKRHECLLTRLAETERVPLLDAEDVFEAHAKRNGKNRPDYFFPRDQFHPSVLGHQVLGEAIAEFLEKLGLLTAPGGR